MTVLNGSTVSDQLSASSGANDNLTAACQGILDTRLAPSASHWYAPLQAELAQAQTLATQWRNQYGDKLEEDLLTCIIHCGQAFAAAQPAVTALFARAATDPSGAKAGLQTQLSALRDQTRMVQSSVANYEATLRTWGQQLSKVHDQMGATIAGVQNDEAALRAQISSINASIAAMQAEVQKDRDAIARAKKERDKGIAETIFGIVFAPFTGGLSLILTGIGVSSIVEGESKVSAMEGTIRNYQGRIVADQQNLTQDQVQLTTLQALSFSAGIALSDLNLGLQMLDAVRVSWETFFQEMDQVIGKITNATTADMIVVEQAWFNAACKEWALIVAEAQTLLKLPESTTTVDHLTCDVPVIHVVPTNSNPPLPAGMKMTILQGPDTLQSAPDCQVLSWGSYTYWVATYDDNRYSMCFLAYDQTGKLVGQLEKQGARYMYRMTLDQTNQSVTCAGQANRSVTVSLADLRSAV